MRKVYKCLGCGYPYPDAPTSQCDCSHFQTEYEIQYIVDSSFLDTFLSTRSSVNFDLKHYQRLELSNPDNKPLVDSEIARLEMLLKLIDTAMLQKEVLDEDT